MSKPEDIPQDVWQKAQDICDSACFPEYWHVQGVVTAVQIDIARAIMAAKAEEQEACAQAIATANLRVAGIETPLMRGDNLAITLCTHFDDGEPSEDDTGWSPAAIAGYEQVIDAIRDHYTSAIRNRATP